MHLANSIQLRMQTIIKSICSCSVTINVILFQIMKTTCLEQSHYHDLYEKYVSNSL